MEENNPSGRKHERDVRESYVTDEDLPPLNKRVHGEIGPGDKGYEEGDTATPRAVDPIGLEEEFEEPLSLPSDEPTGQGPEIPVAQILNHPAPSAEEVFAADDALPLLASPEMKANPKSCHQMNDSNFNGLDSSQQIINHGEELAGKQAYPMASGTQVSASLRLPCFLPVPYTMNPAMFQQYGMQPFHSMMQQSFSMRPTQAQPRTGKSDRSTCILNSAVAGGQKLGDPSEKFNSGSPVSDDSSGGKGISPVGLPRPGIFSYPYGGIVPNAMLSAPGGSMQQQIQDPFTLFQGMFPPTFPPSLSAPYRPGIDLALSCDSEQLSEYQMLVRQQLEIFEAGPEDVDSNTQGRKKQVSLGQVGLRCKHCALFPVRSRGRGAVYYPAKLQSVYQAAQNMAGSHLCQSCQQIPIQIKQSIRQLRERRDNANGGKQYWADGCRALGIYETEQGLRLGMRPS